MNLEINKLPLIRARYYKVGRSVTRIKYVVIHTAETPETDSAAEGVANYFKNIDRVASAHITVDNNSAVRSVADKDTAWAAPPCNSNGLHLELAGRSSQSAANWSDVYSTQLLKNAAVIAAQWCMANNIYIRKLTTAQLKEGKITGIVGHADVTNAFHQSDHTDPGRFFPWKQFIDLTYVEYRRRKCGD